MDCLQRVSGRGGLVALRPCAARWRRAAKAVRRLCSPLVACCDWTADQGPLIRIVTIETKEVVVVGSGWLRAEWSPDSKSLVGIGYLDNGKTTTGVVRLSAEPGRIPEALFPDLASGYAP